MIPASQNNTVSLRDELRELRLRCSRLKASVELKLQSLEHKAQQMKELQELRRCAG